MIVLDTNVLSEPMHAAPSLGVLNWLDIQPDQMALTAISVGELLTGISQLPGGKRRDKLAQAAEEVLGRWALVLPYDTEAARAFARIRELARAEGRGISIEDGMIAAICIVHGATLATRNTSDFDFLPVPTVNPWLAP